MSNYGKAGPGREYESNPDPRFNPEVAEQIRNSIGGDRNEKNEAFIAWSKQTHAMIHDGGAWGVPRSGLIFIRNERGFALANVLPYTNDMRDGYVMGADVPATPEELLAFQRQDFDLIRSKFALAGLEISDPRELLTQQLN